VESGGWRPTATATAAGTNEDGEGGACSGQYQLV
jgi:hypothetical protein